MSDFITAAGMWIGNVVMAGAGTLLVLLAMAWAIGFAVDKLARNLRVFGSFIYFMQYRTAIRERMEDMAKEDFEVAKDLRHAKKLDEEAKP